MLAECIPVAVFHKYYLKNKDLFMMEKHSYKLSDESQTNRGGTQHWRNGTAVFWCSRHGQCLRVVNMSSPTRVVAVVFPEYVVTAWHRLLRACIHRWVEWMLIPKIKLGHWLYFFSLSRKPQLLKTGIALLSSCDIAFLSLFGASFW